MIIVAAVLLVVSVVGLIAAVIVGGPAASHPRHGTFGIDGFDGSFIAWACVGSCAVGLLLLFIDSKREKSTRSSATRVRLDTTANTSASVASTSWQ